jgi:4'-phosphopantetheinyl transferase
MTPGDAVSLGGTAARGSRVLSRNTVLSGGMIDVWWFDTRSVTVGPSGLAGLDRGERSRAEAFMFPADRHRYQVAHTMLRRVLASYTGTPPGQLPLGRERCPRCGAAGKPVLLPGPRPGPGADTVPSFSLAHSGDMVVIAVADGPVGVDVERDAAGCVCSVAKALHPADAAWLAGLAEPDRHEAIITCWVRAEAVLKCTGEGIGHGLGGFPVRPGQAGGHGAEGHGVNGCAVRQLPTPAGYRAAVALAGAGRLTPRVISAPAGTAGAEV